MEVKDAIKEIKEKIMPICGSPALELAVTALEKQIPKPPKRRSWEISKCPCCEAELGEWLEDGYHKDYTDMKVCNCGQQLDWDEKEKCMLCGCELNPDETEWITKHYPICSDCRDYLTPEEMQEIIENYG